MAKKGDNPKCDLAKLKHQSMYTDPYICKLRITIPIIFVLISILLSLGWYILFYKDISSGGWIYFYVVLTIVSTFVIYKIFVLSVESHIKREQDKKERDMIDISQRVMLSPQGSVHDHNNQDLSVFNTSSIVATEVQAKSLRRNKSQILKERQQSLRDRALIQRGQYVRINSINEQQNASQISSTHTVPQYLNANVLLQQQSTPVKNQANPSNNNNIHRIPNQVYNTVNTLHNNQRQQQMLQFNHNNNNNNNNNNNFHRPSLQYPGNMQDLYKRRMSEAEWRLYLMDAEERERAMEQDER